MENLTKHQLILVALLISFVTSIATGIVTVSLMDQAPKGVTQTINRVVERTVERVVTEPNKNSTVVKETIVVKEEDKIVEAIEKNAKSMVRIYKKASSDGAASSLKSFVGLGVIISKDGDIATDESIISSSDSYSIVLNDGVEYEASVLSSSEKKAIGFLKISTKEKEVLSLTPAILADSSALKLGQTVISLGGKLRNSVSIGVITSFVESDEIQKTATSTNSLTAATDVGPAATTSLSVSDNLTATASGLPLKESALAKVSNNLLSFVGKLLNFVETNIVPNDNSAGNPIINLSGEVVGVRTILEQSARVVSFVPSTEVQKIFYDIASRPEQAKQNSN